jgi:UDPglucose--hexose-1-phosphate uridylyltransferase
MTPSERMHRRRVMKPDGREMWLYGRAPIPEGIEGVAPQGGRTTPNPHMRWHPLRGEWITYAGYRQNRTFLPPAHYDPLSPSTPELPTEIPPGEYDVAVFENLFPSFAASSHDVREAIVPTAPATGTTEVVVFTQSRTGALGDLPPWHVELILSVWADRTRELGARPDVQYVFPFENRGTEVGVTLHHPHGQIYAYPFVPPVAANELRHQRAYYSENAGRGLLADHLAKEVEDGRRVIASTKSAVAIVPVCARYAYEIWVAPLRPAPLLVDLDDDEIADLAAVLKASLRKLDRLWNIPMPYILAVHQAPTDGTAHPWAHVHVEIYPALRMPNRLKYLAGSETGAGAFTADTIPEEKAAELRAVDPQS